ncbi:MAG: YggT family protein [Coriobacteriales bacterium]|jgi:uncharacterized protein YggT (Ycf19 family)|nr:YggT family protein [Coriobacteriales bacterium]
MISSFSLSLLQAPLVQASLVQASLVQSPPFALPLPFPTPALAVWAGILPYSIARVLIMLVNFYVLLIIVWALFSWFGDLQGKGILNDIYRVLNTIVGPFIGLFKRFIPPMGGIDISPIIAILLLQLLARFIL